MRTMLLAACLILAAGPLRAAQDADKAAGKPEAKPAKTAAKAPEAASTAPTKPEAAQEDRSPKSRTLQEIIALVLREGTDRKIGPIVTERLGLSKGLSAKAIRFKSDITPDKRQHGFYVLYEMKDDKINPVVLWWGIDKIIHQDGRKYLDGWSMLVSLDGNLQLVLKETGQVGKVSANKVSLTSSEAKALFAQEMKFYCNDSYQLERSR